MTLENLFLLASEEDDDCIIKNMTQIKTFLLPWKNKINFINKVSYIFLKFFIFAQYAFALKKIEIE